MRVVVGTSLQRLQKKFYSTLSRFRCCTLILSSVSMCEENSKYIFLCFGLNKHIHVFLVSYSFFSS